jgi:acyl carrier protein
MVILDERGYLQITKAELHSYLIDRLRDQLSALRMSSDEINDDFDFFMSGLLDSFGFIDLLLGIEQRYQIELRLDDVNPEVLSTFGSLAQWLEESADEDGKRRWIPISPASDSAAGSVRAEMPPTDCSRGFPVRTSSSPGESLRLLTDFRGDFDRVAALMEESWAENRSQSLLYTADFLESCFRYPGATYAMAPTMYYGSSPVGFIAGIPRSLQYKGKEWKVMVVTFMTVATQFKKKGYGIVLWNELVKRARAFGFDGMVNYCVDGEAMNGMIVGCCQRLELPVERVYSIPYLTKILWPKVGTQPDLGTSFDLVHALLDTAAPIPKRVPLARLWTREEAMWQLTRAGAITAYHQVGARQGMLTGYIMELVDADHTRNLLVEDVLWGLLEGEERVALVRQFTEKAAAQGARMANVPLLGYADMEPFRAAGFRPSRRMLHTYLTLWNDSSALEPIPSLYLDVF